LVDASLVIEGAVAVGTIGLSLLTVYQTQLLIRERRASQARELAEKIYTPLRQEVSEWKSIETARLISWRMMQNQMPYLTLRVPKEITALLDQGVRLLSEMALLEETVRNYCEEELKRLGWELAKSKGQQTGLSDQRAIQVLVKNNAILNFDRVSLPMVWTSGRDLYTWVADYAAKNLPGASWDMLVLVGGQKLGGLEEAKVMADKLFESLASRPDAQQLREKARVLRPIGVKLVERINKELAKEARLEG
jgi:hypothetical protein